MILVKLGGSRRGNRMTFHDRALSSIGVFPKKVLPDLRFEKEKDFGEYIGYLVSYNLEEDERVASIILKPKNDTGRQPAILAIHQHNDEYHLGKSEVAGWDVNGNLPQLNPMYAYGQDLVKRGYVVICPDMLCFEERHDQHIINSERDAAGHEIFEFTKRIQLGSSLLAKYLHDMSVAVDMLCTLDYVDSSRIGVIGHSLGGQSSLYMTWFDDRIKVGASSCGFSTLSTILRDRINHNKSMYIPGFSSYADTYDVLCDIAPRAFAFTAGNSDIIFPIDGVHEVITKAEERYANLCISDRFKAHLFDGGHSFKDSEKSVLYDFIDRILM